MRQEPTFIVGGESLMDVFPSSDTPRGLTLDARIGGSPLNVAIGLARMAQSVAFLGAVSRDAPGRRIVRALRDEGVDLRAVQRSDAPTTLSVVDVDAATGAASYTIHGERGADRQLTPDHLAGIPVRPRAVHVGSFAMVVDPIGTALRALVESARSRAVISWDPNVRLVVVPDPEPWRAACDWMLPRAHVVKLSDEDLPVLSPGTSAGDFAQRALQAGVCLVAITHGDAGASLYSPLAQVNVPAGRVAVVDTVGAGDTFQAALLTWLSEHDHLHPVAIPQLNAHALRDAGVFAAAAAAITCTRQGADLPRRAEMRVATAGA